LSVTISAGVAGYPLHGGNAETLLTLADDTLYDAKNGGRNRVAMASPKAPDQ
jgi:diguanylate cyclase (GGDEF)-like protein